MTGTSFLGMLEAPIIPHPEPSPPSAEQVLEAARLAAVGGIAGEVVHELNNPLFAILGLVEMLLKDAEPGSRAEHRLALVQQTGIELRELVRTFAGFARDSGETTSVELADAVAQAVAVTSRAGATKDIEVSFRAADGSLRVTCGKAHLTAIVLDLIGKARHALPGGGTVVVMTVREGDSAVLHIAAEGTEVAPHAIDAGAGIALDAAAVRALGGTLAHGPGAEFFVRLPLSAEETAS